MDGNVSGYAPTTITISAGAWGTAGNRYDLDESNSTSSIKRYFLSYNGVLQGANLGISFTISGTTITLDVNDSIGGTERPSYYINGGTTISSGTGTVSVNDVIELWGLSGSNYINLAEITVPPFLLAGSNAVLYYDATGTTFYGIREWNSYSESNAFKVPFSSIEVPSSLIDFSVFTWGTSIEYAQEYLSANFGDLNPRFILNGVQATSSNSDFASTTQYLPNGHGVNFWGSSENIAEFKFTSNINGKCKIVYGCTWNQNAVRIALNGTLIY